MNVVKFHTFDLNIGVKTEITINAVAAFIDALLALASTVVHHLLPAELAVPW